MKDRRLTESRAEKSPLPRLSIDWISISMDWNINRRKILLTILASGFGNRFGGDKLVALFRGKKLYTYMLDALKGASEILNGDGREGAVFDIAIVTNSKEILEDLMKNTHEKTVCLDNPKAAYGISESIKRAVGYGLEEGYNDIAFFLADMPGLCVSDIVMFMSGYIKSGKNSAIMCSEGVFSNPAAIDLSEANKLLALEGDTGALKIILSQQDNLYVHPIEKEKLLDIDRQADLKN